ncbi:YdaS family helix-turn-helix protein [Dyella sp.]|uniref:YdaS family helix-turn-helix protein n=1 Tax=Dyella sp. TaxID=1869338 RepID=UPI00284F47A7|nr:YdaS family helix-turn-helix protein [Dyella sp.]MDR3445962.1 YdaS family helix-turn-helix protein [Dyella sp.]
MKTLRAYLSTLSTIDQAAYAKQCGTTIGYLRKALSTKPRLDGALVRRLDEESGGQVSRQDLRPDIFGEPSKKKAA